jgi:Sec-independent protein translocase protein TatA
MRGTDPSTKQLRKVDEVVRNLNEGVKTGRRMMKEMKQKISREFDLSSLAYPTLL